MNELQISLIGAGAAAVIGIIGFNKWQEYRHRKRADAVFPERTRDPLLEAGAAPIERVEPTVEGEAAASARAEPGLEAVSPPERAEHERADSPRPPLEPAIGRRMPSLPPGVDPGTDCVVLIEAIEAVPADALWPVAREELHGQAKRVVWFALSDAGNEWLSLPGAAEAGNADRHHWYCVAMQLVDRGGPLTEAEFGQFIESAHRVADAFMAVPASMPAMADVLSRAGLLDRVCAEVDVQIGINIVSQNQPFMGTKLRGVAEASGLALRGDGLFHYLDEEGSDLFVLANAEGPPLAADTLRNLQTHALTLVVEVPRIANVHALDRMMAVARQLADALGGVVVDDKRVPIGQSALSVIREQVGKFHQRMRDEGIAPGSALARRLFS